LLDAMREDPDADLEWALWHSPVESPEFPVPEGESVSQVQLPVSARWSNLAWHRVGLPIRLERFLGDVSIVHGTDFVVPPSAAPSVVTIHDLSYALLPSLAFPRLRKYLERAVPRSIDRARKVIAVSETTKRDLCEYYEISPNRVEVVHHAADPLFHEPPASDVFAMQAQFGLRKPYFIIVGTVEPRKDHQTLLAAFEKVHQSHPEASLVIVGKQGWLAEGIIESIQLAARKLPVYHLQGIRDNMLSPLYAGSAGLVYPSRYEGFGLPLLEAMASGTAVIASDTPAHREVAGDAANLVPPQDPSALASEMRRLLESDADRSELIRRGRERARTFSWKNAAQEHLRIYREVAGE
jgi:glycosyltransferase involved in cell wall biosynthesis